MPKRQPHKKQHTVPKTYLENFADPKGSIWMLNTELKIYPNAPKNTLTRNFYYNVTFNGKDSLIVEKGFLGALESEFANVYHTKIKNKLRLTDEEKVKVSLFVAAQFNRVPGRRDAMRDFLDRVEKMTERMKRSVEGMSEKERENLARFNAISSHGHRDSIPADDLIKMKDTLDKDYSAMLPELTFDIAPIIFSMNWGFMVYEKGDNFFITSDDPCTMANPDLERHYGAGTLISTPGLGQKGVELMIPLSPTISLLAGWLLRSDRAYIPVTSEMVDDTNKRHLRHGTLTITNSERHAQALKDYVLRKQKLYAVRNVLSEPIEEMRLTIGPIL